MSRDIKYIGMDVHKEATGFAGAKPAWCDLEGKGG
jgi:hypothetical protein